MSIATTDAGLGPFLARRVLGDHGVSSTRVDQIARHVASIDLARLVLDAAEHAAARRRRRRLWLATGAAGVAAGLVAGVALHRRRRRRRGAAVEPTPLRVA